MHLGKIIFVGGLLALMLGVVACSQDQGLNAPGNATDGNGRNKDGTETLGTPSIPVAAGSGFVEGGVGMIDVASGQFDVTVPAGATVNQVLLYWAGGTTGAPGDDEIVINGTAVSGALIGGPVQFFRVAGVYYDFSAYRADVTGLGLVQPGLNSFSVTGFDFDTSAGTLNENNGCSLVVIYDDGSAADLSLLDGLDMAYFGFEPTLDATVPQVFSVEAADVDRSADLMLLVASVGEGRPNRVLVSTSQGDQVFDDVLGSLDGMTWDSLVLPVDVPAGETELTVQLVSTEATNPEGASLGWVGAGLAIEAPAPATEEVSGTVFVDADNDLMQGIYEAGIGNVVVDLVGAQGELFSVTTDADGHYLAVVPAGTYTVQIDVASHPDTFNDDLGASFAPTTPLVVPVAGAAAGVDFGFVPVPEAILADLDLGELATNNRPLEYWLKVLRGALITENSGRRANGHNNDRSRGRGWGHTENFPDGDELRALLAEVQSLYLPDPYVFTPGEELEEAFAILKSRPGSDSERLYRELLVTELNYVADRGLINEFDRIAVLISWGEALIALGPEGGSLNKDRSSDIRFAFQIFEAINTGGGGGVDE